MLKRLVNAVRYRWKLLMARPVHRRLGRQIRALDAQGFVLITNNCLAGQLYEFGAIRKATPTAGLFFSGQAFPQFLHAIARGETCDWSTLSADRLGLDEQRQCPVLALDHGSAVVFLHYRDPEIAIHKWNNRFQRIAGREKIVIASLRDGLDEDMLSEVKHQFRHFYITSPAPSPSADEIVLDRQILNRLAGFLDGVLS